MLACQCIILRAKINAYQIENIYYISGLCLGGSSIWRTELASTSSSGPGHTSVPNGIMGDSRRKFWLNEIKRIYWYIMHKLSVWYLGLLQLVVTGSRHESEDKLPWLPVTCPELLLPVDVRGVGFTGILQFYSKRGSQLLIQSPLLKQWIYNKYMIWMISIPGMTDTLFWYKPSKARVFVKMVLKGWTEFNELCD